MSEDRHAWATVWDHATEAHALVPASEVGERQDVVAWYDDAEAAARDLEDLTSEYREPVAGGA